jgi:hypothetical protein
MLLFSVCVFSWFSPSPTRCYQSLNEWCYCAGAQGLGLLAASYLGSTLEDFLALAIAGLASYVAVLNLPLRRAEIKGKVATIARNFADSVTSAMAKVRASI